MTVGKDVCHNWCMGIMDYEVLPPTCFVLPASSGVSIALYGQSQVRIEEGEGEKKRSYPDQLYTFEPVPRLFDRRLTAAELPAAVTYHAGLKLGQRDLR